MSEPYRVELSAPARRALSSGLPEKVATAALDFISGALADNPKRVGKQLHEPLFPLYSARRGEYRVLYRIDEDQKLIGVVSIQHRRDAYRSR